MFPQMAALDLAFAVHKVLDVLQNRLPVAFLFNGKIDASHTTGFAIEKFVDRYGDSVDTLNRALMVSVAFVPIALLPSAGAVKVPLLDIDVSRLQWLRMCPAISFTLQIFTLVALCWFLLLRGGLAALKKHAGNSDKFGDVANVMLRGVVGAVWILLAARRQFPSKWHSVWFIPSVVIVVLVLFSPSLLCGYFGLQLFGAADYWVAGIYTIFLVPSAALAILLVYVSAMVGLREIVDIDISDTI